MSEKLTEQQQMAVENRGGKLLVSAAAGSGKTKVLVDRLLLYLLEGKGKVNIDDFLIITYTKAAASELRIKIASKLNERLAEQPENRFLQRQVQRLYLTKISTVHGFCTDILRENAHILDIPGDFRVAEEQETLLLQLSALDKLMERIYTDGNDDFYSFVDSQEMGREDNSVTKIVLQVYKNARCHLNPDAWLDQCASYNECSCGTGVEDTIWGNLLIEDLHRYLDLETEALTKCLRMAEHSDFMESVVQLLQNTVTQLTALRNMHTWDEIVNNKKIIYGTLRFSKKCVDTDLMERIKAIRTNCKKNLDKKLLPFADYSAKVMTDLQGCAQATRGLISLIKQFSAEYEALKRSKRIMDFSDLEHKTLDLLMGKKRQHITSTAYDIGKRFQEIMVDEYQDSNAVQEGIFNALTFERQNCFMVGDVKQSIYQFREADPGIFLDKYHSYVTAANAEPGQGRKVLLSSNFRSAGPVIQAVNDVFSNCMSPAVGGLCYGSDEALHEGIPHIPVSEAEIEFHILDIDQDTYAEEATFTANRIAELLDGTHYVRQGDTLRPIVPEDIVILLRSPNSVGGEFRYALERKGIPVNFGNGENILITEEISFVHSMLQVIDNPHQDIPLAAVLTSRVFCFSADELAVIRANGSKRKTLYESLCCFDNDKVKRFLLILNELRKDAMYFTLSKFVDRIFSRLKLESLFSSFENGDNRVSNLQSFSRLASQCESTNYRELGCFLEYLNSMDKKGLSIISEQSISGAVTIMSIHKSKGLEFPVVFLCGLSKSFNRDDLKAQVLCHKELGIGLNCVDLKNRVRYPSVAKKAIASKIVADSISEEMRILYVAMTRARDRLIMTYALRNPSEHIQFLANRMDYSAPELITSTVNCPGTWILLTALGKIESGSLFAFGSRPLKVCCKEPAWLVSVNSVTETADGERSVCDDAAYTVNSTDIQRLRKSLSFQYPHEAATVFPSKQTATQLKGRTKDQEAAENTQFDKAMSYCWRTPSFVHADSSKGIVFGNTVHKIMQYINFSMCDSLENIQLEINRMALSGLIDGDAVSFVDPQMIHAFFVTDFGRKLILAANVLREFKFSVLDNGEKYDPEISEDQILLQGVIDCAIIEDDNIAVVDFKTDQVEGNSISELAEQYRYQVLAYAEAISRIYKKKVSSAQLYFFRAKKFMTVI